MNGVDSTALVIAARNGDRAAGERLAAQYLPLVYNVVGRALNGHPDVDDVVQETMLRALSGLPALRDPARFRSWLVAIAMNQVRSRWSNLGHRPAPLEETSDPADPAADFVDLTILRLELSGQRRETAEATRWLDDAERDVLSLWWLETTGDLTRSELAEALGLSPQHAAVRVQRVKNQLDVGRTVVRALASDPRCPALEDLLGDWDGTPTPLWRKRIARHVRGCASCSDGSAGLVPPEGLLSGLALVVPLYDSGQQVAVAVASSAAPATASATAAAPAASGAAHSAPAAFSAGKAAGLIAGAAAVTALAVLIWPSAPAEPESRGGGVTRVNTLRAANGCPELETDPRLTEVAQRHSEDMAARNYFDHTDSSGRGPGDRVGATGYAWSAVGETIATGMSDPAAVVEEWRNSPGRDDDIFNCDFVHVGVGIADSPRGPYWTQVLATPS
ncbi:sigma-70 family RNA polymerase sigma factor [Streptomyces parvus]|uniref:sigma-70 family RNA polymerase sigma factor n=1 Tax=Streptomyces parvus TaxID=66428 RepID=UPI001239459F|nr:sigma-70 family RNA polymerase sigma factor [Streptomyces parvus]KAA6203589.1 sigma-70 family RNA polymerase sigma factor [Streptomyces parvus]